MIWRYSTESAAPHTVEAVGTLLLRSQEADVGGARGKGMGKGPKINEAPGTIQEPRTWMNSY